jgi:uncharacterized protein YjbJ (UPF0337 family)
LTALRRVVPAKVSAFEQTRPEKVFTLTGLEFQTGSSWVNCQATRDSKMCLAEIYITSKTIRRNQMNQSTKDEIKGNMHEAKGTVKEKAAQITNNPDLTAKGQNEKLAGKVQKKVGQIEKVLEK